MPSSVWSLLVAAAVITVAPPRTVVAQSTLTTRVPAPSGREEGRRQRIYMVIQTESTLTQEELGDTFKQAQACCRQCTFDSYGIDVIDPNTYVVLDSIMQGRRVPSHSDSSVDSGRCYLVTLKGVQGDEKELYDTLKDPKKIAMPLRRLQDFARGDEVVIATFQEITHPRPLRENEIVLAFPKPGGGVEPKRMWMRFPLTKTEEAAIRQELDAKFAGDGFKTVPAWIRQNQRGEKLTPEGSTGWFELPWNAEHQAFERTFPIDENSWQQRLVNNKESVGENAILVYEFEGEDGSQRIIKLDNGKYYRPYQVAGWLTRLQTAPAAK